MQLSTIDLYYLRFSLLRMPVSNSMNVNLLMIWNTFENGGRYTLSSVTYWNRQLTTKQTQQIWLLYTAQFQPSCTIHISYIFLRILSYKATNENKWCTINKCVLARHYHATLNLILHNATILTVNITIIITHCEHIKDDGITDDQGPVSGHPLQLFLSFVNRQIHLLRCSRGQPRILDQLPEILQYLLQTITQKTL